VYPFANIGHYRYTVEGDACNVEFQRKTDEAGHWVVEEDLGCEGHANVSRILRMAQNLKVFWTALAHTRWNWS
jgi:hypothetical protein